MALLGAQLVITLIMVSVIQKLGSHFSFSQWLLCSTGLIRYLHPTDDELRTAAGIPKDKAKGRKGGRNSENGKVNDTFHIPRNLDIQLETTKVTLYDVVHLKFYKEYQWLVDFSLYSAIVYLLTEVYNFFIPLKGEFNLSIMWCLLVIGFSLKLLTSLTVQYFHGEESVGERSTVIVTGFSYLVISMMVLIVDERKLELGLDKAYSSFNESAAAFLDSQGLDSSGPASKLVLKFFLSLWCAVIGALFTFPGLRMAKMHWDSLRYCTEKPLLKVFLNLSFASPLFLVILWVRPVSRDYLTQRVFYGLSSPLLSDGAFDSLRLIAIGFAVILRFFLMPVYLQAYLNMAYHRIEEQKKEAGRITNIEYQKKVAAVFYYLCVVVLQYVAPLIMCLFFTFIYKTLGEYTWNGMFVSFSDECPISAAPPTPFVFDPESGNSIQQSAQQFTLALDSLKQVFTTDVFRGLFGFLTWWTCFSWFASSSLGMVYQSYFSR